MEKIVNLLRDRRTGHFLLHPMGLFDGYGAYVGTNPIRQLPATADAALLGQTIAALLDRSGPTGYSIKAIADYRAATGDDETNRLRQEYFPSRGGSTAVMAERFMRLQISFGQYRSWQIISYRYDKESDADLAAREVKVMQSAGLEALGREVLSLVSMPNGAVPPPSDSGMARER